MKTLKERFDEFIKSGDPIIGISDEQADWIKDFVETELSALAKKMIEKIDKLQISIRDDFDDGYDQAKIHIRQAQMNLLKDNGINL